MSSQQDFQALDVRLATERAAMECALRTGKLTVLGLAGLTARARSAVQSWEPTATQTLAFLKMQLPLISDMKRGWMGLEFAHRCLYVLRIDQLLESAYPNSGSCALRWLHTVNWSPTLAGRVPMNLLVEPELSGCAVVHDHLELLVNNYRPREARQ